MNPEDNANVEENLPFLVMNKYHLSRDKARNAVIRCLGECGIDRRPDDWDSLTVTWNDDEAKSVFRFRDLVDEARLYGVVPRFQRRLDSKDPIFGGTIQEMATPNWQFTWKTSYAGFEKKAQGPFRSACVEQELTEDILEFRRLACEHSAEYDFRLTCRYFRAYLSACVSILDAFINRHVLLAKHEKFDSPEFRALQASKNLEERVRHWFTMCSEDDPTTFFGSTAWCHFQELREKRNELMHGVEPIVVYSVRDMHAYLNKVRTGVGELLLQMRTAHSKPTVGFIERLRTAPLVDFNTITFRANEPHKVKKRLGQ